MNVFAIADSLQKSAVFSGKKDISEIAKTFTSSFSESGIANGDDTAAIPDGHGEWNLLAAEGVIPALVNANPELAGRSAVLANINDVYAMGGRPTALVDVVGAPHGEVLQKIVKGMIDNAKRFGVPVVGGHLQATADAASVSMAVLGHAKKLITSFDAEAGDVLVLATNMDGIWLRTDNFWNCTLPRHDAVLKRNLEILPAAAEKGLVKAGKDVSMAGIAGTLAMLCETSRVGAELDLDALPLPEGADRETDIEAWLRAFFSYGFILAVKEKHLDELLGMFRACDLFAAPVGYFNSERKVTLHQAGESAFLCDLAGDAFIGF